MSTARERVLASVRTGLLGAHLPDAHGVRAAATPRSPGRDGDARVARFVTTFEALKGAVIRVATPAAAIPAIADLAGGHGAASFVAWDDEALECPGLAAGLTARGLMPVGATLPAAQPARHAALRAMGAAGIGITGADAALADTGSLVLLAGPGRGRLVSALPPVHVALLPVPRICDDLATLLAERPGLLDESSNAVVITGPSRTADIEMTLTHGVHGPKHLYAVLIG